MNKRILLGLGLAMLLGVGAGCSQSSNATAPENVTTSVPDTNAAVVEPTPSTDTTAVTNTTPPAPTPAPAPTPTPTAPSPSPKSTQTPAVKEFTVTGSNFSFTPKALTVNKGDHVKITFKNADGMHDFRIDEFNVASKRIAGGEQDVVEFTADKTGDFQYYCSVGSHRAMGMWGTLSVK